MTWAPARPPIESSTMSPSRLEAVLAAAAKSPFYSRKLAGRTPSWAEFPLTTKSELIADQAAHPPYGSNLTRPVSEYTRLHQTSGTTTGQPLRWLDTAASWQLLLGCWRTMYEWASLKRSERIFFAFSFGPFLGFWTAFEAAQQAGHFCLAGGGMSSAARLRMVIDNAVTVVLCTPTYALHLAETASRETIDLPGSAVHTLIVAGEPGGLIPNTRAKLASAWGARVVDHYGLTEVGPVAIEPADRPGDLRIVDGYVAEVIDPDTLEPAETGELVLTTLSRLGSPLVRYRTGDLVQCATIDGELRLAGGILGRADDMIHVRGNNVYPTAVENILRRFPELAEYRMEVTGPGPLNELTITVEPLAGADGDLLARRVADAVRDELLFRAEVDSVAPGALPRFEMKARRFIKRG